MAIGNGPLTKAPTPYILPEIVGQLDEKKVINRHALIQGEPGAEHDLSFGLEPELLVVVVAALVSLWGDFHQYSKHTGQRGWQTQWCKKISLQKMLRFTSISKPKAIPELAVKELFTHFGVEPELLDGPHTRDLALVQFQNALNEELNRVCTHY